MHRLLYFALFFVTVLSERPLQGLHLIVAPIMDKGVVEVRINANGSLIEEKGRACYVLQWLSELLGFKYSYLQYDKWTAGFINTPKARGASSYIQTKEVDIALSGILMTEERNKEFGLPYPWGVSSFALLIPSADISADIAAPGKPFDLSVWILFILAALIVPIILYFIGKTYSRTFVHSKSFHDNRFEKIQYSIEYVVLVLCSQGGVCSSSKTALRLVAGAWCLGTFVLVQSYCSTLTSFLTSPTVKPLINSIYDIPKTSGVHVIVQENRAADLLFRDGQGIAKYVREDLNRNPKGRCQEVNTCMNQVKAESNAFVVTAEQVPLLIQEDLKNNGKCGLASAKETFMNNMLFSISLHKLSPCTELINNGVIRLWETGLLDKWRRMHLPNVDKCVKANSKKTSILRLNLNNLSGIFILLAIGYGTALVAFSGEMIAVRVRYSGNVLRL